MNNVSGGKKGSEAKKKKKKKTHGRERNEIKAQKQQE